MRYPVIECDGCGKNLYQEKYYHEFGVDFKTWVKDPNTGQTELNSSMTRVTKSIYCNTCYDRLIEHMESFVEESIELEKKLIKPISESGFNQVEENTK